MYDLAVSIGMILIVGLLTLLIAQAFRHRSRATATAAADNHPALTNLINDALDNMSDAFILLDRDWRFVFLNAQAKQLLMQNRPELLGTVVWEQFPEAVGSAFEQAFRDAVDAQKTTTLVEYYAPLKALLTVKAYPSPSGLAVYFQDITLERAHQERLQLLETAVSRQNDILLITEAEPIDGPDGPKIIYANDAFYRRTGFTPEEVIGATPRILQGPATQRDELDRIRAALEKWQPVRSELINYTKDGRAFWLELDIVPIANQEGWYTHWVAIERDITDRKQAEQAALIHEERFRLLARVTNDVIWDWDMAGDSVWWNGNLESMFGYDPVKVGLARDSWSTWLHPDDRVRVLARMQHAMVGDGITWNEEYRLVRADGTAATVIDRGFIIRDEHNAAVRMLGSIVDVTDYRELDERLRQSQKLEAVGQLTGGISHDFNNLLTVILGNTELLVENLANDHQSRQLAEVTAMAAQRGAELTNRLLSFARRQPLDPKIVDINKLVAGMDGLLRRTLGEDIDIEIVRGGGLWFSEIDPGQLEAAVLNLAVNSRGAMPAGGELTIETANAMLDAQYANAYTDVSPGQYVLLSISDTGTGMSTEVAAKAFDPFFTTKKAGEGSGLGLSMVYGFVKQSGGHIKIYSEIGQGSTVKLYLPRANSGQDELPETRPKLALIGGEEKILVVEDDMLVQNYVMSQLETLGYSVIGANSGPQALELLKAHPTIDLLFTDVVMPGGMNGPQLAKAALQLLPELKVLFTSGYTENAIVHHGRLDRGVHLLSKPYRRQELAAKIRTVLNA